jgi:ferritin-like metal-binding protein YciE
LKEEFEMKQNLLRKIYIHELKVLYSAENQFARTLARLSKEATSPDLRTGFEALIRQTREHVARLARIFEALAESPEGKHFKGMAGLIREDTGMIADDREPQELDVRLIAAARRAEHYEMAGYGCVHTYARLLGENEAALLLEQTLNEEEDTDAKLTELAETIIIEAMELEDPTPAEKGLRKYLKKSAGA